MHSAGQFVDETYLRHKGESREYQLDLETTESLCKIKINHLLLYYYYLKQIILYFYIFKNKT